MRAVRLIIEVENGTEKEFSLSINPKHAPTLKEQRQIDIALLQGTIDFIEIRLDQLREEE